MHRKIEVCFAIISLRPICEIGSGLVRHLNVYSSFEFPIPVNIRLGYGGNSLRGGSAMKHEEPSCRPTRKRTRQNEVWHFIIRDEGLKQQTMHFNWHTSKSCTVSTISRVRCSMRCLPPIIITAQLHQSGWSFILLYDQFHCFQYFRLIVSNPEYFVGFLKVLLLHLYQCDLITDRQV